MKEQIALGAKQTNPKFNYQRHIANRFISNERKNRSHEKSIFDKMEDLLDDEEIRQKILKLE